jgi:hypothetical protein
MKRIVVVGLMVAAALSLVTVGVAYAQDPQPPFPRGGGMGPGGGMMGPRGFAADGEMGPMHEYMEEALADALGISHDEFETRREAGETAYEIALAEGFSADEIPTLLRDARTKAWEAAAKAGVITQEQLDWMKSRPNGTGTGNCDGTGQRLGGMMGGWRFQQSNP